MIGFIEGARHSMFKIGREVRLRMIVSSPETSLRQKINVVIGRLASIAGAKALAGDPVNVEIDKINALRDLLAALPAPQKRSAIPAVAVALACLAFVSLALAIPVSQTRIKMVAKTTRATILLSSMSRWSGDWEIDPSRMQLGGIERIDFPPEFNLSPPLEGRRSLDLNIANGSARINRLEFQPKTKLIIETNNNGVVQIFAYRGDTSGDLTLTGLVSGIEELSDHKRLSLEAVSFDRPPALIRFSGTGLDQAPVHLRFSPLTTLTLRGIPVAGLSVLDDSVDLDRPTSRISGLVSGELTLSDTGDLIELTEGTLLNLEGASGILTLLQISDRETTFIFEGAAKGLSLGTGNFYRSLMPDWLHYWAHQQTLGFFWSAIVFLYGLVWSARKLVLST